MHWMWPDIAGYPGFLRQSSSPLGPYMLKPISEDAVPGYNMAIMFCVCSKRGIVRVWDLPDVNEGP